MRFVRNMRGNAQTWDPLGNMIDQLRSSKATAERADLDLKLPSLNHGECLALRALTRCDQDSARAIALLQEWSADTCDMRDGQVDAPVTQSTTTAR